VHRVPYDVYIWEFIYFLYINIQKSLPEIISNLKNKKSPSTMTTATQSYPVAPDHEWPEAWIMPDNINDNDVSFDQCQPNRCTPNIPVTVQQLKEIGIEYWKMNDVDTYQYPIYSVPYNPQSTFDPKLMALRDHRGYSYADIITVHPDHLPNFDVKIKSFFEEVGVYVFFFCILGFFDVCI
jgi:hypothetical protein